MDADGPAVTSRALGLQPRGVEVLDRLGALGDLQQRGLPVRRLAVNVDGRPLASRVLQTTSGLTQILAGQGRAARLYEELGPQWALIGSAPFAAIAHDRLGDVVALPGSGESMLVRPDGHLAWNGSETGSMHTWLDATRGRPALEPSV
jgi:hypothetical protein